MKNPKLPILSTLVLCSALAGCGEDPILLAELLGAGEPPSSDDPSAAPEPTPPSAEPPRSDDEAPRPPEPSPGVGDGEVAPDAPSSPLEAAAFAILLGYCGECHDTAPEPGAGDLNYIGDIDELIAQGRVVPGSKEDSPIWARMVSGTMPPLGLSVARPSATEIELVGLYIDSLDVPEPEAD